MVLAMELFTRLFGHLLAFVYHCFDRIVIHGYLTRLSRPEHVVHFFREVNGAPVITKEILSERTNRYQNWVEAFARNRRIPIEWAEKGIRKEDFVRRWQRRMVRNSAYGYFIFKSLEVGTDVPYHHPEISHQRSQLPHCRQPTQPLHPLLLLHSRRSARSLRHVRGLVLPLQSNILPQRPQLH